jgi:hypothetical protein
VPGAVVTALVLGNPQRAPGNGTWNADAIRATLERVVPAHNDASFIYVLENRTDSDYRIAGESEVRILGRGRSKGELVPKVAEHVSGEFPLVVPARRKVHFALVWTADRDIDPARIDDFVHNLNIKSFVLFDQVRRYQIEFPGSR